MQQSEFWQLSSKISAKPKQVLFNLFVTGDIAAILHTPEYVVQVIRSYLAPPALMIL